MVFEAPVVGCPAHVASFRELPDSELFDEILRRRAQGGDIRTMLGELTERWRRPAGVVVRRIQSSYRVEAPDDESELFQEGVQRLLEKGLDQYRGVSEQLPGRAASPKTFFLRIVKHLAIDRYRAKRELLAPGSHDDEEQTQSSHEANEAIREFSSETRAADARELYWKAYERLTQEHPHEAAAWDVYHHKDVEDHNECARQLSITVANSYKRVSRAQAYLRRYLLELLGAADAPSE